MALADKRRPVHTPVVIGACDSVGLTHLIGTPSLVITPSYTSILLCPRVDAFSRSGHIGLTFKRLTDDEIMTVSNQIITMGLSDNRGRSMPMEIIEKRFGVQLLIDTNAHVTYPNDGNGRCMKIFYMTGLMSQMMRSALFGIIINSIDKQS